MDYKVFYKTFLAEMPWRVPGSNDFEAQYQMLHELLNDGAEVFSLGSSIFKIVTNEQITYWFGTADAEKVAIIVDTEASGSFCKVTLTSKNPQIPKSTAPFASDIYIAIKQDLAGENLVFTGDTMMTNDAIRLWSRLVQNGNTIGIYDTSTQQYALNQVTSPEELQSFTGSADKQKYIFVLSESKIHFSGNRHGIAIMEIKRKSGYPLAQLFEEYRNNK